VLSLIEDRSKNRSVVMYIVALIKFMKCYLESQSLANYTEVVIQHLKVIIVVIQHLKVIIVETDIE